MNRLIFCIILLGFGHRVEPDGSIPFSPVKPPAGVEYKAVEAAAPSQDAVNQALAQTAEPSILSTSEASLEPAAPPTNTSKIITRPATAAAVTPGLSYAPEVDSRIATAPTQNPDVTAAASPTPRKETIASTQKRQQCEDLTKRVLSLERRLRSPLDAQAMDTTVVAMARYQRSFDQYCVE